MASLGRLAPPLNAIVSFALPPRCAGCGTIVDGDHRFCIACWKGIEFLGDPQCAVCALPLPFAADDDARCGACLAKPPAFDRLFAAAAYGELTRSLALKLKYGLKPATAVTMARLMARNVAAGADALLVPVPLHRWRIWRRGYNQSALIARALSRASGLPLALDALKRTRPTPALKDMSLSQRRDAVRGAFDVIPAQASLIRGRNILLVDDVYTTGSTAGACAKALKRAGARRVEVHVWARVVRPAHLER